MDIVLNDVVGLEFGNRAVLYEMQTSCGVNNGRVYISDAAGFSVTEGHVPHVASHQAGISV